MAWPVGYNTLRPPNRDVARSNSSDISSGDILVGYTRLTAKQLSMCLGKPPHIGHYDILVLTHCLYYTIVCCDAPLVGYTAWFGRKTEPDAGAICHMLDIVTYTMSEHNYNHNKTLWSHYRKLKKAVQASTKKGSMTHSFCQNTAVKHNLFRAKKGNPNRWACELSRQEGKAGNTDTHPYAMRAPTQLRTPVRVCVRVHVHARMCPMQTHLLQNELPQP